MSTDRLALESMEEPLEMVAMGTETVEMEFFAATTVVSPTMELA
jgi:hypothetical protein